MKTVIIIGAGRSGTKFLRDIFASNAKIRAVPYDVNYIWREGNEAQRDDELSADSLTDGIRERIRLQLRHQARIAKGDEDKILLEKSVPNSLRVPFVASVFPEALYIHLVRDGRQVVESAYRNWKRGPEVGYLIRKLRTFPLRNWRYGIRYAKNIFGRIGGSGSSHATWGPRYSGIDEDVATLPLIQVVARQWARCVQKSLDALQSIPLAQRFEIRYEDLIADDAAIMALTRFIGLSDVEQVRSQYWRSVHPPEKNGWQTTLSDAERECALKEIGDSLYKLGYF